VGKAAAELPHSIMRGTAVDGRRLVLEDGAGFGDVGVEVFDEVGELLFYYAAAEF
jgi:hypothetical protein